MILNSHRPDGFIGEGDKYFLDIFNDIKRHITNAQKSLRYDTLRLPPKKVNVITMALVDFTEDIYNDIGIWKSYERYNMEFFGDPLPLTPQSDYSDNGKIISERRVNHFLWMLYTLLNTDLLLSPTHTDLYSLTATITEFLQEKLCRTPKDSGIKKFLYDPNEYGWNVKKKLLWLGQHSYLFRHCFHSYIKNRGGKNDIGIIDDFVCQETTLWSGLGVVDILAAILNINNKQRLDLRSWYERHAAYYRIEEIKEDIITALNLINNKNYKIRTGEFSSLFKQQEIIFGSLVPWNDEWYWSGSQQRLGLMKENDFRQLRNDFVMKASNITYRYYNDLAEKARENIKRQYKEFVEYHNGKDLVVYPDGLSMAADEEKRYRLLYESKPKDIVADVIKKYKLKGPKPQMSIPSHILECDGGVAIFFNKDEGEEIFIDFTLVKDGFKKKGVDLNDNEKEGIREVVLSDSVSPKFVDRMIQEYGHESIGASFLINGYNDDKSYIGYLLRKYKGHFYRKRYPHLSFVLEND